MTVTVVVATFGGDAWKKLAISNAYPSAAAQATEVVLYHDPTGTLARARNQGASMSHCDWLCFLDADDQLAPGYMTAMRKAIVDHAGPTIDVKTNSGPRATRHRELFPPVLLAPAVSYYNPGVEDTEPAIPNAGNWPVMNECVIGTLVPRLLFERVGGFEEWTSLEDYELWLRCVKGGATIRHVPEAVYRALAGRHRNADQSPYHRIKQLHQEVFV